MRFVFSYHSTSLRLYLKNPGLRVCFNRRLRRGAALRRLEDFSTTNSSKDDASRKQQDKDDYYALLLASSLRTPTIKNSVSTAVPVSSLTPKPSIPETSLPTSPRIVFGSRLAGPAAREKEGWGEKRPQEPDNCCMSGCVNCVWDTFREEVEQWSARQRQRQKQVQEQEHGQAAGRGVDEASKISSMDSGGVGDLDGMAGSNLDPDSFFKDLPVGIKEFIALEKRLKDRKSMQSDCTLR